jgi:hypothetical protein
LFKSAHNSWSMNRIGLRTTICMLVIAALAVIWNVVSQ